MRGYILFMLFSLVAIALALVYWSNRIGGSPARMEGVRERIENGIIYETFYIEGMPCMRIGRGDDGSVWEYDGVTCDWSKWEGK